MCFIGAFGYYGPILRKMAPGIYNTNVMSEKLFEFSQVLDDEKFMHTGVVLRHKRDEDHEAVYFDLAVKNESPQAYVIGKGYGGFQGPLTLQVIDPTILPFIDIEVRREQCIVAGLHNSHEDGTDTFYRRLTEGNRRYVCDTCHATEYTL